MTAAVDHAVINVRYDMDAAVARFDALGFSLTPRGHHSLGSINHLMVFEHDYLELVGLPAENGPVRREIAEAAVGLNGLAFATANADAVRHELALRGVPAHAPLAFDRPIEIDGAIRRVAFRTVRVDPDYLHGGRAYFCEHVTPELVWRPEWQTHRNRVHALAGMTIAVPDPASEAQRYCAVTGAAVSCAGHGKDDVTVAFGAYDLCLTTPERYRARYGALACDAGGRGAFMGALVLATRSLDAVRACLEAVSPTEQAAGRVVVPASAAFNTVIEFVAR